MESNSKIKTKTVYGVLSLILSAVGLVSIAGFMFRLWRIEFVIFVIPVVYFSVLFAFLMKRQPQERKMTNEEIARSSGQTFTGFLEDLMSLDISEKHKKELEEIKNEYIRNIHIIDPFGN